MAALLGAQRLLTLSLLVACALGCPTLNVKAGRKDHILSRLREFSVAGVREQRPQYTYHSQMGVERFYLFWSGGKWIINSPAGLVATLDSEALTPHNATDGAVWKAYDKAGKAQDDHDFRIECPKPFNADKLPPEVLKSLDESIKKALQDPGLKKTAIDHSAYLKVVDGSLAPVEGVSGMYVQVLCPSGSTCLAMGSTFLAYDQSAASWSMVRDGAVLASAKLNTSVASIPPLLADDGEVLHWTSGSAGSPRSFAFSTQFLRPEVFRAECSSECIKSILARCNSDSLCQFQAGLGEPHRVDKQGGAQRGKASTEEL